MRKHRGSRFTGCRGKARFASAEEAASGATDGHPEKFHGVTYPCAACGCWHVASR
jgi:hypothetical protein